MVAVAVLRMGQRRANALMTDTVRVFSRVNTGDFDPVTGDPTYIDTDVYVGPGKLVLRSSVTQDVDAGGQLLSLQGPRLDLPVETPATATGSTADVRADHIFEVTASETDDGLVGAEGVVKGRFLQTYATARRLPVRVEG